MKAINFDPSKEIDYESFGFSTSTGMKLGQLIIKYIIEYDYFLQDDGTYKLIMNKSETYANFSYFIKSNYNDKLGLALTAMDCYIEDFKEKAKGITPEFILCFIKRFEYICKTRNVEAKSIKIEQKRTMNHAVDVNEKIENCNHVSYQKTELKINSSLDIKKLQTTGKLIQRTVGIYNDHNQNIRTASNIYNSIINLSSSGLLTKDGYNDLFGGRGELHKALTDCNIKHVSYSRDDIYSNTIRYTGMEILDKNCDLFHIKNIHDKLIFPNTFIDVSYADTKLQDISQWLSTILKSQNSVILRLNQFPLEKLSNFNWENYLYELYYPDNTALSDGYLFLKISENLKYNPLLLHSPSDETLTNLNNKLLKDLNSCHILFEDTSNSQFQDLNGLNKDKIKLYLNLILGVLNMNFNNEHDCYMKDYEYISIKEADKNYYDIQIKDKDSIISELDTAGFSQIVLFQNEYYFKDYTKRFVRFFKNKYMFSNNATKYNFFTKNMEKMITNDEVNAVIENLSQYQNIKVFQLEFFEKDNIDLTLDSKNQYNSRFAAGITLWINDQIIFEGNVNMIAVPARYLNYNVNDSFKLTCDLNLINQIMHIDLNSKAQENRLMLVRILRAIKSECVSPIKKGLFSLKIYNKILTFYSLSDVLNYILTSIFIITDISLNYAITSRVATDLINKQLYVTNLSNSYIHEVKNELSEISALLNEEIYSSDNMSQIRSYKLLNEYDGLSSCYILQKYLNKSLKFNNKHISISNCIYSITRDDYFNINSLNLFLLSFHYIKIHNSIEGFFKTIRNIIFFNFKDKLNKVIYDSYKQLRNLFKDSKAIEAFFTWYMDKTSNKIKSQELMKNITNLFSIYHLPSISLLIKIIINDYDITTKETVVDTEFNIDNYLNDLLIIQNDSSEGFKLQFKDTDIPNFLEMLPDYEFLPDDRSMNDNLSDDDYTERFKDLNNWGNELPDEFDNIDLQLTLDCNSVVKEKILKIFNSIEAFEGHAIQTMDMTKDQVENYIKPFKITYDEYMNFCSELNLV